MNKINRMTINGAKQKDTKYIHLDAVFSVNGVKYAAVLENSRCHRIAVTTGAKLVNSYENSIKAMTEFVFELKE